MTIIIFILVLSILVFVHELGHFLAAKRARVRVEEFGFGYPPRAAVLGRKWGTLFSLNWIPFGGFVKILGENYDDETSSSSSEAEKCTDIFLLKNSSCSPQSDSQGISQSSDSKILRFTEVSKKWQAVILSAGVAFNILFAWLLFSLAFMIGVPAPIDNDFGGEVRDPSLMIIEVLPDSPSEEAGLKTGDKLLSITLPGGDTETILTPEVFSQLVSNAGGEVILEINRGGENLQFEVAPTREIVEGKNIIGISMDVVGTLTLPAHKAIIEGAATTIDITKLTLWGFAGLIADALRGEADISQISGPVGIVGLVGDASRLGFAYLITFTALISINLAIINFFPFPALDGGRLVFVAVEAVTKRPINPKMAATLNTAGFALLILLMLVITYRDILNLF